VTAGTVYGLSISSDDALNVFGMVGSGVRVHNGNTYGSGFSNPFGPVWGSDTNGAMSIYASGITETGNVASTYSNNGSSLLSSIPLLSRPPMILSFLILRPVGSKFLIHPQQALNVSLLVCSNR
jgi:hypothetical protein